MEDYHLGQSRDWLVKALKRHNCVKVAEPLGTFRIRVERKYGDEIILRVVGDYVLGEWELDNYANGLVHCIVMGSSWLDYTNQAKKNSVEKEVGLFTSSELFGALNREHSFWKYTPKN